ncbi:unnamed protein product [Heligmosomoides polygyrus]|uniref:Ribosomal_L7Ae domain-containing protein n=1 Tax=Heligmosomoides polygyrus TaxID=6339 RepID=A0A183F2C7_HELPZ|nr:unnamed protein product [Heligmosomoides polygyrus]
MGSRIASSNEYVADNMPKGRQPGAPARIQKAQLRGQIAFTVPLISNALSAQVRECVRKADLVDIVRVIEVPPANLKAVVGVTVTILAREVDIAARKAPVALWIAFKSSAINRKEERVAVTQESAPIADLCGLDPGGRQLEGR